MVRNAKQQRKNDKKKQKQQPKTGNPRGPRRIRGKGDYIVSGPFEQGGTMLGRSIGGYLGGLAGRGIGSVIGSGDYAINSNTLLQGNVPQFGNGGRSIRVKWREYIGDIVSSATPGAFKKEEFHLNPGDPTTFPWLSNIADGFQEWEMNGCIAEFISKSGLALNSTNTALGSLIMATRYNPLDPPFISKPQMENSFMATPGNPSQNCIHAIECAKRETTISVLNVRRPGQSTSDSDDRFYDLGKLNVATVGLQGASVNCGELWISYDVTLLKPISGQGVARTDKYTIETAAPSGTRSWFGSHLASFPTLDPNSYSANSAWVTLVDNSKMSFSEAFSGHVVVVISQRYAGVLTLTGPPPGAVGTGGVTVNKTLQSTAISTAVGELWTSVDVTVVGGGTLDFGNVPTFTGGPALSSGDMYIQSMSF